MLPTHIFQHTDGPVLLPFFGRLRTDLATFLQQFCGFQKHVYNTGTSIQNKKTNPNGASNEQRHSMQKNAPMAEILNINNKLQIQTANYYWTLAPIASNATVTTRQYRTKPQIQIVHLQEKLEYYGLIRLLEISFFRLLRLLPQDGSWDEPSISTRNNCMHRSIQKINWK